MKAYLFFLVFINVFFLAGLQGQTSDLHISDRYENATHYYKGNELWINDTINYFSGSNIDWTPVKRLVVLSRDGLGQELETVLEYYNPDNDQWNARIKNSCSYYYFEDTPLFKDSKTQVWNTFHKKWITTATKQYNKSGKLVEEINLSWGQDSPSSEQGTRAIYTYKQDGELLMVENHFWDVERSTWNKKERISSHILDQRKTFLEDTEKWNEAKSRWILSSRNVITHDDTGNIIKQEFTSYDATGENKVLVNTTDNQYDSQGNLREIIRKKDMGYRKTGIREQNLYRNDGKLVKTTRFTLESGSDNWIPTEESRHIYQVDLEVITQRTWNADIDSWTNGNQQIKRYKHDLLIEKTNRLWDLQNESWQYTASETYGYENQNLTSRLIMIWDPKNEKWINQSQMFAEFNPHGKSMEIVKHWSGDNAEWEGEYQNQWKYDDSGNIISYEWHQKSDDDSWVLKERADFGWHMFALSKTESKENYTIEVFPNPTRGVLHIKTTAGTLTRIAILDQTGQLIEATSLAAASTTIDISHLPSGNYFIECNTGIQTNTFKVVKL